MTAAIPSARHLQFERLAFFSDAVFAIAITLLVIEIKVPHIEGSSDAALRQGLVNLFPNYVGFLVSFLVIGRFWMGHHRIFGYLKDWDARLVHLNLLFLGSIAFLPFPTAVVGEYGGMPTAIRFYAGCLIAAGICNLLIVRHVRSTPALLAAPLTPVEVHALRSGWLPLAIGVAAFAASYTTPLAGLAVLVFGGVFVGAGLSIWGRRYRPV